MNFCTSSCDLIFLPFPEILLSSAMNVTQLPVRLTFNFQLSSGLNAFISLSLSTINLTATD